MSLLFVCVCASHANTGSCVCGPIARLGLALLLVATSPTLAFAHTRNCLEIGDEGICVLRLRGRGSGVDSQPTSFYAVGLCGVWLDLKTHGRRGGATR